MREVGQVVQITGEYAVVNVKRKSMCGSCCACELGSSKKPEVDIKGQKLVDCKVGDYVYIEMSAPDMLRASAIAYGIPLLALLFGIVISYFVMKDRGGSSELISFLTGLLFMAVSFLVIHKYDNRLKDSKVYEPRIVDLASKADLEPLLTACKQ